MSDKRRTYGQYETPPNVADLLLGFCIRRPDDRVLDPSCGAGRFLVRAALIQEWLAPRRASQETLWGVEVDAQAAQTAREALPAAHIIEGSFFEIESDPSGAFDAVVGNPPYTRAEWIGRLDPPQTQARQLILFPDDNATVMKRGRRAPRKAYSVPADVLNRRAGLHAHFIIHATPFLREGGRFGFVVPNSWLDVAYGERLKQYILDHFKIVAVIESGVERWFQQASVNTCLLILERSDSVEGRQRNKVRLVRLRRELDQLIPHDLNSRERPAHLEALTTRMMPSGDSEGPGFQVRVRIQETLAAGERWGVALRAPRVYRRHIDQATLVPLSGWARVQRGYTSGANGFFYLDENTWRRWEIEEAFLRPLLKSLRLVQARQLGAADCHHRVLFVPPLAEIGGSKAQAYITWGEEQGFHQRRTCASRRPWYSLPEQEPADLILPKGIWARHGAPIVREPVAIDQQLYGIFLEEGTPLMAAAALLNSAWCALQMELNGRINLGEGVLWLANYEVEQIRLPDPRALSPASRDRLTEVFASLSEEPMLALDRQIHSRAWQALNEVVFSLIGFAPDEGRELLVTLAEHVSSRQLKARSPGQREVEAA